MRVRLGETRNDATLRRAVVARVFADWVDATREGRRAGAEEGLSASERREVRAAIREAEMIRGWVALMLASTEGCEQTR